ncbi:hypothetical protein AVEN_139664-1 [Araneus ventricosus]|uniref:Uncharacterized protein n=1 Tax=Araneus ventricosus TaxID=182803 RepID=A0A4Y2NEP6_ARAVE|nr:hypothetical protein AVEN_211501-1 [Araneus ventricosus]GBN37244.1 hypothetical protein AVEN_21873-1 [Araneus ventricosus]GBN68454.1 hypothetical protein AVEN_60763-1 [Araneus ventricosus]GBN68459.1 hypothetical protein AVEN_139664-1 [Araneus ventricosus]
MGSLPRLFFFYTITAILSIKEQNEYLLLRVPDEASNYKSNVIIRRTHITTGGVIHRKTKPRWEVRNVIQYQTSWGYGDLLIWKVTGEDSVSPGWVVVMFPRVRKVVHAFDGAIC